MKIINPRLTLVIGQSHVVDKQHYGFHPTLTLHNVTSQGLNEKLSGLNKCVTHLTNDTWLGVWENGKTISSSEVHSWAIRQQRTWGDQTQCHVLTHFLKDKSCWRWTVDVCMCLRLFYLWPVSLMSWYYTFLCVQAGHKSVHVCPFVYPGQDHTWAAAWPPVFIIIGGNFEKSTWIPNVLCTALWSL